MVKEGVITVKSKPVRKVSITKKYDDEKKEIDIKKKDQLLIVSESRKPLKTKEQKALEKAEKDLEKPSKKSMPPDIKVVSLPVMNNVKDIDKPIKKPSKEEIVEPKKDSKEEIKHNKAIARPLKLDQSPGWHAYYNPTGQHFKGNTQVLLADDINSNGKHILKEINRDEIDNVYISSHFRSSDPNWHIYNIPKPKDK